MEYVDELELTSYLIRYKNKYLNITETNIDLNQKINKLLSDYIKIKKKISITERREITEEIILLSEKTKIDKDSFEKFGNIILLIIKRILSKPNFSNYTWVDDFYSDATYKILQYSHNFDHTKKSKITGQRVNAFAYISQIIHNAIIYVINQNNKNQDLLLQKTLEFDNLMYKNDNFSDGEYIQSDEECKKIKNELISFLIKQNSDKLNQADRVTLISEFCFYHNISIEMIIDIVNDDEILKQFITHENKNLFEDW